MLTREISKRRPDALQVDPPHARMLGARGVRLAQQGQLASAERLLREALKLAPGMADLHNNLGMILHGLRRTDEAIAAYRTALAIRPEYIVALNNLGMSLAALNHHAEAITCYYDALGIKPAYPEALNNLGSSLHALGRCSEAVERFQKALALRPDFVEARINLGHALAALGRPEAAIRSYETALIVQPADAALLISLAAVSRDAGRNNRAVHHYRKAIAIQPNLAAAHAGLGSALLETGRIAEAHVCFERAIELEPRCPSHFLSLVHTKRMTPDNPHFNALSALANDMLSLSEVERVDLHFAWAKALSDVGQNHRSFEHLLAGNALKRRTVVYDEPAATARLDRISTVFTAELMRDRAGCGDPSAVPIFIIGMPRSGSTLVEQILASHPAVVGLGETRAFAQSARDAGLFTPLVPFPDSVPNWTDQQLHELAGHYLGRLSAATKERGGGAPPERIVNKMLVNFQYVGLIRMTFPNARIVHMQRNAVDTCLSCFSIQFKDLPFTYDLGELGRRYAAYTRLMAHWKSVLLPCDTMLDVQYENLVKNFETEARRIVEYCGLDWDDRCLRFHETVRVVRTASVVQVRQPIYKNALQRWRPSAEALWLLLDGLGPSANNGHIIAPM